MLVNLEKQENKKYEEFLWTLQHLQKKKNIMIWKSILPGFGGGYETGDYERELVSLLFSMLATPRGCGVDSTLW